MIAPDGDGAAQRRRRRPRGPRLPAGAAGVLGRRHADADPVPRARLDHAAAAVCDRPRPLRPGSPPAHPVRVAPGAVARRSADRVRGARRRRVSVADLRGDVRFSVPGKTPLWSSDGRLAVAGEQRTVVLSSAGRRIADAGGVARAWSRDGSTLALVRPGALLLARPGRPARRASSTGGARTPYWVAFTPDGRTVVFAGGLGAPQMAAVAGGPVRAFAGQPFGTWSRPAATRSPSRAARRSGSQIGDRLARNAKVVARLPYDEKGVSGLGWLGDGSACSTTAAHVLAPSCGRCGPTAARSDAWEGARSRRRPGTATARGWRTPRATRPAGAASSSPMQPAASSRSCLALPARTRTTATRAGRRTASASRSTTAWRPVRSWST